MNKAVDGPASGVYVGGGTELRIHDDAVEGKDQKEDAGSANHPEGYAQHSQYMRASLVALEQVEGEPARVGGGWERLVK